MQEAGPFPSVPDLRGVISACCWCFPCSRLFKRRGKERWSLQDLLCVFKSLMLSDLLLLPLSHTALKTAKTVFKKIKYQQIGLLFSVCDRMLREPDCNFLKGDWPATVQCFVPALDAILCCCTASLPMLELSEMHHSLPYMLAVLSTVSAPG